MKILFAGIIARYPYGGVTWCSLMYLLGLRALGHEVLYLEDTGECIYDPEADTRSTDPSYGTRYIRAALEPFGLAAYPVDLIPQSEDVLQRIVFAGFEEFEQFDLDPALVAEAGLAIDHLGGYVVTADGFGADDGQLAKLIEHVA